MYLFRWEISLSDREYFENLCKTEKKTDGEILKAANRILKKVSDKSLINLAADFGTYIPAGHCKLCAKCSCRKGLPCVHADTVRYSFESLGVSVSPIAENYFGKKLHWYHMNGKAEIDFSFMLPEETAVYGALLTNKIINLSSLSEYLE